MSIAVAEEHINNMKRLIALSRSQVMSSHSALAGDSLNFDELIDRLKTAEKHSADAVFSARCADSALPLSIRSDIQKLQHGGSVSNMPNMFSESIRHFASKGMNTAQETALFLLNEFALQHSPCAHPSHLLPVSHMLTAGVFADVSLRSDARSLDKQVKALSRLKDVSVSEHTESARIRITCAASSFIVELVLEKFLHCYEISSINVRPLKGPNNELPSAFFTALRASTECRLAQLRQTCRYRAPLSPRPAFVHSFLIFSDPLVQLVVWLLNFSTWHRDCASLQVDGFVDARIGESAATAGGRLYNPSHSESPPRDASRKHKLQEAPAAANTRTRSS
jgi:hypothetical protein